MWVVSGFLFYRGAKIGMGKSRGQAAIELRFCATAGSLKGQAAIDCASHNARTLRAQAAMEYLVTYGWALLALFVVIALLLSSGAFSLSSYSVSECTFQPDLPCPSFILYKTVPGTPKTILKFSLSNGLGFPIKVNNVNYTVMGMNETGRHTYPGTLPLPSGIVYSGYAMNFTQEFAGTSQPSLRELKTIYVSITYSNCKGGECKYNCTSSGRITTVVEAG